LCSWTWTEALSPVPRLLGQVQMKPNRSLHENAWPFFFIAASIYRDTQTHTETYAWPFFLSWWSILITHTPVQYIISRPTPRYLYSPTPVLIICIICNPLIQFAFPSLCGILLAVLKWRRLTNYISNKYWGVQILGSTHYMLHRHM